MEVDTVLTNEFIPFPKIGRLFRPVTVTEKLDGTNAAICVKPVERYRYDDEEIVGPGIVINTNGRKLDGHQLLYIYMPKVESR